ncbi:MAG: heavy-metal-associated domain-containing protein [Terracidiphilus sp.]
MKEWSMEEFTLQIDGMHCPSCVRRVQQALAAVQGVEVREVRVGTARLASSLLPAPVDLAVAALARAGYAARQEA